MLPTHYCSHRPPFSHQPSQVVDERMWGDEDRKDKPDQPDDKFDKNTPLQVGIGRRLTGTCGNKLRGEF